MVNLKISLIQRRLEIRRGEYKTKHRRLRRAR